MTSVVIYLAVFGCFAATVLATPKNCYYCMGGSKDCGDLSKDDLEKGNMKQSCADSIIPPPDMSTFKVNGKPVTSNVTKAIFGSFDKQFGPSIRADPPASPFGTGACVKLTFTHPALDGTIAYRGCLPKSLYEKGVCTILNHGVGAIAGESDDCSSCTDELCNSGFSIFSRSSIFLALASSLLFKLLF